MADRLHIGLVGCGGMGRYRLRAYAALRTVGLDRVLSGAELRQELGGFQLSGAAERFSGPPARRTTGLFPKSTRPPSVSSSRLRNYALGRRLGRGDQYE